MKIFHCICFHVIDLHKQTRGTQMKWPWWWIWSQIVAYGRFKIQMLPCCRLKVKLFLPCAGCIERTVSSPNQHLLRAEDVVSCCLDLSVPSISFRINGQPVQGMFENFNSDGLFFPVASFSAGVKSVKMQSLSGGCAYCYLWRLGK